MPSALRSRSQHDRQLIGCGVWGKNRFNDVVKFQSWVTGMVVMGVTKIGNTQAPKLLYNETHILTLSASLISTHSPVWFFL